MRRVENTVLALLIAVWIAVSATAIGQGVGTSVESIAAQVIATRQLVDERHNLYNERAAAAKAAVESALVATTKATEIALAGVNKANEIALAGVNKANEAALAANKIAVDAAFSANKELTAAAFAAAKEAVQKAEAAQVVLNEKNNEFRKTLEANNEANARQNALNVPRIEYEARLKNIEKEISELRSSRSTQQGSDLSLKEAQAQSNWTSDKNIALFAVLISVFALIASLYIASKKPHPVPR